MELEGGGGVLQGEGLLQELTIVMGGLVVAGAWDAGAFFLAGLDFLGESMVRLGGACLALSTWMSSLRALTSTCWRKHNKYVRTVQRSLSLESLICNAAMAGKHAKALHQNCLEPAVQQCQQTNAQAVKWLNSIYQQQVPT